MTPCVPVISQCILFFIKAGNNVNKTHWLIPGIGTDILGVMEPHYDKQTKIYISEYYRKAKTTKIYSQLQYQCFKEIILFAFSVLPSISLSLYRIKCCSMYSLISHDTTQCSPLCLTQLKKHTSLLQYGVNYNRKSFVNIAQWHKRKSMVLNSGMPKPEPIL